MISGILPVKNPERARHQLLVCALITTIVVSGFFPSYIGAMVGGVATPLVIHFHAIVFSGWLVLFTTQALLPALGRVDLHRKLGKFGIGYAIFLILVGVFTAINRFAFHLAEGGDAIAAKTGLLFPLSDMLVFPVFFAAAIAYRHKPEIHKRLMLVATVLLTVAAVARMDFVANPPSLPLTLAVWLSPIYLSMIYDYYKSRLIHPVYVIGLVTLTIFSFRALLAKSAAWQDMASWLAERVA